MYSVHELKEKLKVACDEISILEVLDISVEDILNRFEDRIEERLTILSEEFEGDFISEEDSSSANSNMDHESANLQRLFEEDGYQVVDRSYFEQGIYDDEEK